jgi:nucleoside-diphosphate-sugar epimerase
MQEMPVRMENSEGEKNRNLSKTCIIFGGAGFVGTHLARHFLKTGRFNHVHIADIKPTILKGQKGITTSITDVRRPIPVDLVGGIPEWIFNLAAVHREPGEIGRPDHTREQYFETNLAGAHNVCVYADAVGCDNIHFTSSISVYGPTNGPTDEATPIQPSTPYGASKYPAELIHQMWQQKKSGRRLIISRPGVLYGPGDPGNILRMINAVRKGYFAYPGKPGTYKSYGYIYGFIDSVDFTLDGNSDFFCYNYVEKDTEPLKELVKIVKRFLGSRALVLPIPIWILLPIAHIVQRISGTANPIHPVRVKKAATPTHIVPKALEEAEFYFKYDFVSSLEHWRSLAPGDFGLPTPHRAVPVTTRLTIERGPEHIPAGGVEPAGEQKEVEQGVEA